MTNRSVEPSYQVLARDLRHAILQGDFASGQQLPTEAELASSYAVSRQTVRRAFQDLVAEGMVYRIRGRGTFAQPSNAGYVRHVGSVDDLMGLSDDTVLHVVEPLARKVDLISAGRLRLSSDVIYRIKFLRLHDEVPFCITTVDLPPRVAKFLSDVESLHTIGSASALTIIGLLDQRMPYPIAEAQQSITVDKLDHAHAQMLGSEEGHPVLRTDRLYIDTNGDCVELATSEFLPEQYSYRISLRRSG